MFTLFHSQLHNQSKERTQAIIEFAIVLPILLMLLVGILEVGRMIFIYSAVNNASREAARYASAVGLADGGVDSKFQYCSEIRNMAKRSAFLLPLADADILISYDDGPGTASFDDCPIVTADTSIDVDSGQRVTVQVSATYNPMVNLIPISSRNYSSASSRTILGVVELEPVVAGGGGGGGGGSPTNTPTPTATATPSPTNGGNTTDSEFNAQIIGWDVKLNGGNTININYDPDANARIKRRVGLMR